MADPYEYLRVARQFMPRADRVGDPMLVGYFDELSMDLVAESVKLMALYEAECRDVSVGEGLVLCRTANISGYTPMLTERAVKEAVYVIAGIDVKQNRARLKKTLDEMLDQEQTNDASPFFQAALSPERGQAGEFAAGLLRDLRSDAAIMREQFAILAAGDEKNFELTPLLAAQERMVETIERYTAAMVRYANIAYGR